MFLVRVENNYGIRSVTKTQILLFILIVVCFGKVTHWQHPRFHAYFPSGNSFPSILADMLSDSIACIGFSWVSLPKLQILNIFTHYVF